MWKVDIEGIEVGKDLRGMDDLQRDSSRLGKKTQTSHEGARWKLPGAARSEAGKRGNRDQKGRRKAQGDGSLGHSREGNPVETEVESRIVERVWICEKQT